MVGFGSSLRMGRRSGWEAAYLDYENLKLLLSQIEAFYENENHEQRRDNHRVDSIRSPQDYRDELFLESDSDKAFASSLNSVEEFDDEDEDDSEDNEDETAAATQDPYLPPDAFPTTSQFSLSYSAQGGLYSSSSEDSTNGDKNELDTCGNVVYNPWRTKGPAPAASASKKMKKKRKKARKNKQGDTKKSRRLQRKQQQQLHHQQQLFDEDNYFSSSKSAALYGISRGAVPDTFIIDEEQASGDALGGMDTYTSFGATGGSAYLTPVTDRADGGGGGAFYGNVTNTTGYTSLSSPLAKPEQASLLPPSTRKASKNTANTASNYGSAWSSEAGTAGNGTDKSSRQEKPAEHNKTKRQRRRKRAWRQRQRRRLARLRKEQERKVPRHMRVAHSKARSVAERFLGLLRAEVEKVTLFAQARLGELADTAGSLRFLTSDELTERASAEREGFVSRNTSSVVNYDYPLSDGGIHPSASSSSEDGAGGGVFPWSDSSSDEEGTSKGSLPGRLNIAPSAFSSKGDVQGGIRGKSSIQQSPIRGNPFSETQERFEATKRKIAHFQEVRRERPVFQRNDHIVGDDLLLVSAVDEADAYSAVGVELLHILKYICLNAIAVRKICKKHDRLLMNRMLGGYYHRIRTTRAQEEATLGGLIALIAGDIYEAHPSLIGVLNHGKLVGVYDLKIQQLANSRTVKVVSSCLALALSEYEVSRTRADALVKLNQSSNAMKPAVADPVVSSSWRFGFGGGQTVPNNDRGVFTSLRDPDRHSASDDECSSGPPSTASSVSLSRLQYTVLSIAALREASRIKSNPYSNYIGRATISFTGQAVIGEGLDGCSRESLDVLLAFNPDSALLLDPSNIHHGLKSGQWSKAPMTQVMTSSLAVALTLPSAAPTNAPLMVTDKQIRSNEVMLSSAVRILPPRSRLLSPFSPLDGIGMPFSSFMSITDYTEFPPSILRANRYSCFLYNANYFIAHPTAVKFVLTVQTKVAFSTLLIGMPTAAAIVASVVHCSFLFGEPTGKQPTSKNLLPFFICSIISSVCAIAGNVIQSHGISILSLRTAVTGRLILGFSASEILQRQFVVSFVPTSLIVAESARLVQFQVCGQLFGLIVGSVMEELANTALPNPILPTRLANWFLSFLWFINLVYLLYGWSQLQNLEKSVLRKNEENDSIDIPVVQDESSDSSGSEQENGPNRLIQDYGGIDNDRNAIESLSGSRISGRAPSKAVDLNNVVGRRRARLRTYLKRLRKLLSLNVAIPITLAMIIFTTFSHEVLLSSCPLITNRYFAWRGSAAGYFLSLLSVMALPVDYFCEQIARRYEERTTLKRGLMVFGLGLLIMVNWGSLFALIPNIRVLFQENSTERHHFYDWVLGVAQYVIGFVVTFGALRGLEISSRSLLSKVSPPTVNHYWNHNYFGVLVTFVGLFSQLVADCQITMVVLSHRVINTDIVNALVFPILIGCALAYYFVRKHYFFLM